MSDIKLLKACGCTDWDRNSIELKERPFTPVGRPKAEHSRTFLDYAISPTSSLVTEHGFERFDVSQIGLKDSFPFDVSKFKRRDAFGIIQAERYDRTRNLWTMEAQGLGSGTSSHFQKDPSYTVCS